MNTPPRYLRFLRRIVLGGALTVVPLTAACADDDASATSDAVADTAADVLLDVPPDVVDEVVDDVAQEVTSRRNWPDLVTVDGPLPPPDLPRRLA